MTDQEFNREYFVKKGREGGLKTKNKFPKDHFTKLNEIRWGKKKTKKAKKKAL